MKNYLIKCSFIAFFISCNTVESKEDSIEPAQEQVNRTSSIKTDRQIIRHRPPKVILT